MIKLEDNIDLQLNFLEGNPIELEPNLKIHKVSFSDINKKKIGYLTYNRVIRMICMSKDDVLKLVTDDKIDVFEFLVLYSYQSLQEKTNNIKSTKLNDKYFIDEFIMVLEVLFDDSVFLDTNDGIFRIGSKGLSLNKDNFYEFQSIIKKRNCLENIEEEKENPANEMAKRLLEKRKKAREKLAKVKSQQNFDGEPLTIIDLISIFTEAEHMKFEDVFQYDIYQFNDQFSRMKIFKDYEVNIQALLAGAKSEDIDIQHWLSKINNK